MSASGTASMPTITAALVASMPSVVFDHGRIRPRRAGFPSSLTRCAPCSDNVRQARALGPWRTSAPRPHAYAVAVGLLLRLRDAHRERQPRERPLAHRQRAQALGRADRAAP